MKSFAQLMSDISNLDESPVVKKIKIGNNNIEVVKIGNGYDIIHNGEVVDNASTEKDAISVAKDFGKILKKI